MLEARRAYQRQKQLAHMAMNKGLWRGELVRPEACSDCGKKALVDGHHADYAKPLEVVWLCRACHKYRHRNDCVETRPRCTNCGLLIYWHILDYGRYVVQTGDGYAHTDCRRRKKGYVVASLRLERMVARYLTKQAEVA